MRTWSNQGHCALALLPIVLAAACECGKGRGIRANPDSYPEAQPTGGTASDGDGTGGNTGGSNADVVTPGAGAGGGVASSGGISRDGWDIPGSGGTGGAWDGGDVDSGPVPCTPSTRWCDGNTPVFCNAMGTPQWDTSCTGATPLCRSGACVACGGPGGPPMVTVNSFCIDSTEVTQGQYHAWLDTRPEVAQQPPECAWNDSFAPPMSCTLDSLVCQWPLTSCQESPQVCVDWCDAWGYCDAAGKRLCGAITHGSAPYGDPSAGQWRAACGGVYPYGDTFRPEACNPGATSVAGAVKVGSLPGCVAVREGQAVYDLSGNAREWEDSCSAQSGAADTCRARGGSFMDSADQLTCEALPNPPLRRDTLAPDLGFRCCSR